MIAAVRRIIGVGSAAIVAMAEMSPEQAISNLSAWADRNGLPSISHIARGTSFDLLLSNVVWIGVGLAIVLFAPDLWRFNKRIVYWSDRGLDAQRNDRSAQITNHEESDKLRERKGLILSARRLTSTLLSTTQDQVDFANNLEKNPIYLRIRPFLSQEFTERMKRRGRTLYVPANNGPLHPLAQSFLEEVDRIEHEWRLRRFYFGLSCLPTWLV